MFVYTIGDIFGGITFILFLIFMLAWIIRDWWVQWRCKHETYYENMACDAICSHCGKKLGFIGTVREQRNGSKS